MRKLQLGRESTKLYLEFLKRNAELNIILTRKVNIGG